MLFAHQMVNFESFLFLESKNFESINGDYFKIVFRPVSKDEISQFYYGKMKNMARALGLIMEHSPEICAHVLRYLEEFMLPPDTLPEGL